MSVPFTLTVPGTDDELIVESDRLVHGGHVFPRIDHGIWDLTRVSERDSLDRFAAEYAAVRTAEGRELDPAAVRRLPDIHETHPLAGIWAQRRASWQRLVEQLPPAHESSLAIDVGAGCGWSAARLTELGWTSAAIDVTIDGGDGLAAARHHDADLLLARADMGALPFASASIDLALFNASLHYAADIEAALREARRVLRPSGTLVVLDSPVFHDPDAGRQMVAEFELESRRRHGVTAATHRGPGFLTWEQLAAHELDRRDETNPVVARFHRWRGARRAGRETAERPLLMSVPAPAPTGGSPR